VKKPVKPSKSRVIRKAQAIPPELRREAAAFAARDKENRRARTARADSFDSPDGQTQSCAACEAGPHRCGRREITVEERVMCDEIVAFRWNDPGSTTRYEDAVRAILKSRKDPT
jgi:hypothetical protein